MQVVGRENRPSKVYLLLLIIVAFLAGGLAWEFWSSQHSGECEHSSERETELSQALSTQAEVLAARNLSLSVEREAHSKMQQMFAQQHQKEKELQRELAFYRSIMAPEHQADGVAIHGLEMTPSLLNNQYRLKLILTQLQKRKQGLKGRVELSFVGLKQGEVTTIPLSALVDGKLNFSFRYFQVLDTELILPEDFELSRVEVKVVVSSSRATVEQSFSVQELFNQQELQDSPSEDENSTEVTNAAEISE